MLPKQPATRIWGIYSMQDKQRAHSWWVKHNSINPCRDQRVVIVTYNQPRNRYISASAHHIYYTLTITWSRTACFSRWLFVALPNSNKPSVVAKIEMKCGLDSSSTTQTVYTTSQEMDTKRRQTTNKRIATAALNGGGKKPSRKYDACSAKLHIPDTYIHNCVVLPKNTANKLHNFPTIPE